jgi:hypothetical protein
MRQVFSHFVDEFPVDQLEVLARPEARLFERIAFGARPALARRTLGSRTCIRGLA